MRGEAHTPSRSTQVRDFSGLRYGNITPTDIDALIEYHNKGWVLIEVKLNGTPIQYGQKLALERLCDDLQKTKPTILILASHETEYSEAIDFANCIVSGYRYCEKWYPETRNTTYIGDTVKRLVDYFLSEVIG